MKIGIVKMGNTASLLNSFSKIGANARLIQSGEEIKSFDKLILPGVGSFAQAMEFLHTQEMVEPIKDFIKSGKYALGICLGMQILFDSSEESKGLEGLGFIEGDVKKFPTDLKIPHMGWNTFTCKKDEIFQGVNDFYLYFVHSYFCPITPYTIATSSYGIDFSAMINKENVYAIQPHPEKSHSQGLQILKNFTLLGNT